LFKVKSAITLSEKEQNFLMGTLPVQYYSSAKHEYSLHGAIPFTSSIANKKGVMILIESKKGVKFGAFFSVTVPFPNGN
jgi:hypothetical protein